MNIILMNQRHKENVILSEPTSVIQVLDSTEMDRTQF